MSGSAARAPWGQPPPVADRTARAAYFKDWKWQLLPRRERAVGDNHRRYEVRTWMVGIVYTIDDDLSTVAAVDPQVLLERLDTWEAGPGNRQQASDAHAVHRAWLRRAAQALNDRTSALPPGTRIAEEDWHLRDLERLRRVAAKAADHLLGPATSLDETR